MEKSSALQQHADHKNDTTSDMCHKLLQWAANRLIWWAEHLIAMLNRVLSMRCVRSTYNTYMHCTYTIRIHIHALCLRQAFYYVYYDRERILLDALRCNMFNGRNERAKNRTRCYISTSLNLLKCAYIIANLPFLCIFHAALHAHTYAYAHCTWAQCIHCCMCFTRICSSSINVNAHTTIVCVIK